MPQGLSTAIIITVLVIIIILSVKSSIKHIRGEGGCCGGSGAPKKIKGARLANVVATKILVIDGMHCGNCSTAVANALNAMEDVNARVNLEKKQAVVKLGKPISDELLKEAVRKAGYTVTAIENI